MTYNQAINYIHSLNRFGSIPGLERISLLLSALGNPQDKLKFIHVAGTNGKGSTSTMLANVLITSGLKVGLYISPFVVEFRERIQINGEYIPKDKLAYFTKKVIDTQITVTEFEFITAVAFLYYLSENCDVVVLETGLGGRFDATNIIKKPLCSIITHINYDHIAILGNTLTEIAYEKCGIIKEDAPVITPYLQEQEALDEIKKHTDNLIVPDKNSLSVIQMSLEGNTFNYKGKTYKTRLIGEHQIENALNVIEAVRVLPFDITFENVFDGIYNTQFPARVEIISQNPLVILDGAHNPNGMEALSSVMKLCNGKITAVIGMMADKDCSKALGYTLPLCSKVITVTVKENTRTQTAEELAKLARNYCQDVIVASSYEEAVQLALSTDNSIFVFGSLYLAGGIRNLLKNI